MSSLIAKRNSVIPRVNAILNEIAESTNGSRSNNYVGGAARSKIKKNLKVKPNYVDPTSGVLFDYMDHSQPGMARVNNVLPSGMGAVGGTSVGGTSVGGTAVGGTAVGGKMQRKPRKDKGMPKKNAWFDYVQRVSQSYGIPYNEALKKASELRKQGVQLRDL